MERSEHYKVWDIFGEFFKGKTNMMTPEVMKCGWIAKGRRCYEISRGRGFSNERIFGVTILDIKDGVTARPDADLKLSKFCPTYSQAETYVETLRLAWASYE